MPDDEALDLHSLCCVCSWLYERADFRVAAISRTYTSADLAWEGA